MKQLFSILFGLTVLIACKKHDDTPVTATITFNEPTNGDTLSFGEELHAEATVSATGKMHGFRLRMVNTTTGSTLIDATSNEDKEAYAIHEHWMNNVTDTASITVTIDAYLDHDGNKTSKQVTVICLP